jgi:SAM-dependent methyltransferase
VNNYEIETQEYLKHGLTLFQYGLFAENEEEHVRRFCELTRPAGVVVDMGAGIGTMGRLLQQACPQVTHVINVTNSPTQAQILRDAGDTVCLCDFHHVSAVPAGAADFVMFNESFGYGDPEALMAESARLLRPGGVLVIKDFSVNRRLLDTVDLPGWEYHVYPQHRILLAAAKAGLRCVLVVHPTITTKKWAEFLQNSKMVEWHGNEDYDGTTAVFMFTRIYPVSQGEHK